MLISSKRIYTGRVIKVGWENGYGHSPQMAGQTTTIR